MSGDRLQSLADKQEITDILLLYCRAIDRRDFDLLRRLYWPDAIDDHAVLRGTVEDFIAYSIPFLEGVVTAHMVSNVLIDMTGPDSAFSESYFSALHDLPGERGARLERTVGGRYLDGFERRRGEWRIASRTVAIDWYRETPATSVWDSGRYAGLANRGGPMPGDPLYRLHPGLRR